MANLANYKEYLLKVTPFSEPKIATGKEAIATMLSRIILLEPGTNPLHPTMGVGLVSKYRFLDSEDKKLRLKTDISKQVEMFLPQYQLIDVDLEYNQDKTVDIKIIIDDALFIYDSSEIIPITLSNIISNK